MFTDQLTIPWSTTSCYTAIYKLRARSTTTSSQVVSPIVHVASGTQYKHTDASSLASLDPISAIGSQIRLVKSVSPTTLPNGGTASYRIRFSNTGSNSGCPPEEPNCKDVSLDDIVDVLPSSPAAASYVAGTAQFNGAAIADPSISGANLTWVRAFTIPAGGTRDLTFDASIPNPPGSYVNTAVAHINVAQIDTTTATTDNVPGTATVTVPPRADLSVAKTGPATVDAVQNLTYTITVTNNGPSAAVSVVVRDTLPAGATFASASNGGTEAGGVVTWPAAASLANGASLSRTVTVTAPTTGTLLNVARADAATIDPDSTNNNGSASGNRVTTTVHELANLAVTKTGPASVDAAQTFTYTITVTNNGPSTAASVVVRDTLPAGVTFDSASNGGSLAAGVVTWPSVPSLANGASLSRTVTVTAPPTGTLLNVARADAATDDPDSTNNNGSDPANRVTSSIPELADLVVAKTGPATVDAAQNFSYTISVTNNGPSDAPSVVVRDTLPAGVTFVSASDAGSEAAGVVTWPAVASLASGATMLRTVTVTAPPTGTLINVARVDAATDDPDSTNNNGSNPGNRVATAVHEFADLTLTKTGPATIGAAQDFTYTITVTNNGPSDAASVVVRDDLPAAVTFVSASDAGSEAAGVVTWPTVGSLTNGASLSRTVTVTAPPTGTLINVARADAFTTDPDSTNNDGSAPASRATTLVHELADLTLAKTGLATVNAAQNLTYTITVTNHGPSDAATVAVQDTLPGSVTFVSASDGGTVASGVVTWPAVPSLAKGDSLSRTVTVTAPTTGTLLNVARADAATDDPDSTNNNGSDPTNRVTSTITELADLVLAKTGPATVDAAHNLSYTITVTNSGPSDAASVVVRDTLPAGVTFVSASDAGAEAGGIVTWPAVATLANGASLSRTVTVTAPPTGTLLNVARADAATDAPASPFRSGSDPANRVTSSITELADLVVAKTGPATVDPAQNFSYPIAVTNDGPCDASAVVVRDALPAAVTFVSASNGATPPAGVVTWPAVASLANGASLLRTVTVTAPPTGTLINVARAD